MLARSLTRLFVGALFAAAIVAPVLAAPNKYLCISDKAAGVRYDSKTDAWLSQIFEANHKFIMRRLNYDDWKQWGSLIHAMNYASKIKPDLEPAWGFFDFDGTYLEVTCNIYWSCQSILGSLRIDIISLRFSLTLQDNYVTQGKLERLRRENRLPNPPKNYDPSRPGDDVLMIGTCCPI